MCFISISKIVIKYIGDSKLEFQGTFFSQNMFCKLAVKISDILNILVISILWQCKTSNIALWINSLILKPLLIAFHRQEMVGWIQTSKGLLGRRLSMGAFIYNIYREVILATGGVKPLLICLFCYVQLICRWSFQLRGFKKPLIKLTVVLDYKIGITNNWSMNYDIYQTVLLKFSSVFW